MRACQAAAVNKYLASLMPGLTAKVFRTFRASWTLETHLLQPAAAGARLPEKLLAYHRANREVAVLCNHQVGSRARRPACPSQSKLPEYAVWQRAVPPAHAARLATLTQALARCEAEAAEAEAAVAAARRAKEPAAVMERLRARAAALAARQTKRAAALAVHAEGKEVALGTSKLNYLDPRISVAWCLRHKVPVEKVYNAAQRETFQWAIETTPVDFRFAPPSEP